MAKFVVRSGADRGARRRWSPGIGDVTAWGRCGGGDSMSGTSFWSEHTLHPTMEGKESTTGIIRAIRQTGPFFPHPWCRSFLGRYSRSQLPCVPPAGLPKSHSQLTECTTPHRCLPSPRDMQRRRGEGWQSPDGGSRGLTPRAAFQLPEDPFTRRSRSPSQDRGRMPILNHRPP